MPKNAAAALSPEQKKLLQSIAHRVWEEIASDVMSAVDEGGGGTSIPRADVIEVVLDAGRFEDDVKKKAPELLAWVEAASYKELIALVRPAFPYAEYS